MTEETVFAEMQSELAETSNPTSPFETATRIHTIASRTLFEHGCEYYPAIRSAADMAFEQFVRPIDFPLVDGTIELGIETAVKNLLLEGLDVIHVRVCGE